MDRKYAYEVTSDKEYHQFLDYLKSKGEKVDRGWGFTPNWKHVAFDGEWHLISSYEGKVKFPVKQASDFLKKYVAVYCATKEEWIFACNYFEKPLSPIDDYEKKGYNTFSLSNKFGGWREKEHFEKEDYNVITFQDWIKKDNIPYSTTEVEEFDKVFEPPINTYGLSVGYKLKEDIIRKWPKEGDKYMVFNDNPRKWYSTRGTFFGDRVIEEFKLIEGHVGFLVSGTRSVYLKAEGFKEFELLEEAKSRYPVGTQYKCLHDCGIGNISSLDDFEYDKLDCIRTNNGCNCVYDEGKWAEIVSQESEKPETTQLIQGKWYVCTSDYWQETSIAKYVKHDEYAFQFSEAYITKDEEYGEDSWGMPDLKSLREASYEELCDFLPSDHPDNPLCIKKWSEGTYVVFCKDFWSYKKADVDIITKAPHGYGNMSLSKCGTIASQRELEGTLRWFATKEEAEEFAKTLKPKIEPQFKVGDWIIAANAKTPTAAQILEINSEYYKCDKNPIISGFCIKDSEKLGLRLALPHEIPGSKMKEEKDEIKVGDWCEIISLNSPKHEGLSGKIGHKFQVKEIGGNWYHATTKTTIVGGCWPLDCIKKIEPPVLVTGDLVSSSKAPDYKVGDYVITDGYSKNYDGRVLKITRINEGEFCYFEVLDGGYYTDTNNFGIQRIKRLATMKEVFEAQRLGAIKDFDKSFVKTHQDMIDEKISYSFFKPLTPSECFKSEGNSLKRMPTNPLFD